MCRRRRAFWLIRPGEFLFGIDLSATTRAITLIDILVVVHETAVSNNEVRYRSFEPLPACGELEISDKIMFDLSGISASDGLETRWEHWGH